MATRPTHAQMDPPGTDAQAFLAACRARLDRPDLIDVRAGRGHRSQGLGVTINLKSDEPGIQFHDGAKASCKPPARTPDVSMLTRVRHTAGPVYLPRPRVPGPDPRRL
jgi:hypothetical protein